MSTTALVSELLVGGILVVTWIALLLLGIIDQNTFIELLKANEFTTGALFLAYSYILGVVLDRIWDYLTKPIDRRIRRRLKLSDEEIKALRQNVFADQEKAPEYIEYIRSRMRIARATLCNTPPLTIASLVYQYRSQEDPDLALAIIIALSGIAFAFIAYYAFSKLLQTYYKQLQTIGSRPHPTTQQPTSI